MEPTEIRNQLKNQSFDNVLPASLKQVGGVVFPDDSSLPDQLAYSQIVNAWQAVHVPTYGNPIPNTGAVKTVTGSGEALNPGDNEVYRVEYIAITNSGGAPADVIPLCDSTPMCSTDVSTIQPASTTVVKGPFFVDKLLPLSVAVTSGTASDISTKFVLIKISQ